MKRQRTEESSNNAATDLPFDDLIKTIRQRITSFTDDQVSILFKDIELEHSTRVNQITQNFPPELLIEVFTKLRQFPRRLAAANPFRLWLSCRTVSKSWLSCINGLDFSKLGIDTYDIERGMHLPRILRRFKFSTVSIRKGSFDAGLLVAKPELRCLSLGHQVITAVDRSLYSQLTQLTGLTFFHTTVPQGALLCMANLTDLNMIALTHITSLHTLTNLNCLNLRNAKSVLQSSLANLTKLTRLESTDPNFFRSGKGVCDSDEWRYSGDWCNGKRHGKGKCSWWTSVHDQRDWVQYDGEWVNDQPHGTGVWAPIFHHLLADNSKYEGEMVRGRRRKGLRSYLNYDTYNGDWRNERRSGYGVYTFGCERGDWTGCVYEGEWRDGMPNGQGKCTYPDGDVFEGHWINGVRQDGNYTTIRSPGEGADTAEDDEWEDRLTFTDTQEEIDEDKTESSEEEVAEEEESGNEDSQEA